MTDSHADSERLRAQLLDRYQSLSPFEQLIVQLFSVIYEPISRAAFITCLNQLGAYDLQGKAYTTASLKPHIERLLNVDLLIQSGGQGPQCHPLIAEVAVRDAVRIGRFETLAEVVQNRFPISTRWRGGPRYFSSNYQFMREVRIALYRHDVQAINQVLEEYAKDTYTQTKLSVSDIFEQLCNNPFDSDWFHTLPVEIYESAISSILNRSLLSLTPAEDAFYRLQTDCLEQGRDRPLWLHAVLIEQLILRGKVQAAASHREQVSEWFNDPIDQVQGGLLFLQGDDEEAIAHYHRALQALKRGTGKRKIYFQSFLGLFFIWALLKQGTHSALHEAESYTDIARQAKQWLSPAYGALNRLIKVQQGDLSAKEDLQDIPLGSKQHSLETLIYALCLYWVDADTAKRMIVKPLKYLKEQADESGYHWLALEAADLLSRLKPSKASTKLVQELRRNSASRSLADLISPQAAWELCLNALVSLGQTQSPAATQAESAQRLVWFVTFMAGGCLLQPREQIINTKGDWSRGRPIALKRLKDELDDFAYLTPQDRRVCSFIKSHTYGWGKTEYRFTERAIAMLVGHPLVFWEESPTIRVDVVKGEPELRVKKDKQGQLSLQLFPEFKETKDLAVIKETPTRLKVVEITTEHRRIAEILGKQNRLTVPTNAEEQVLNAINAVSRLVTVQSDIGGGLDGAETVPANAKPHLHLLPAGSGLKVVMLVQPFGQDGPYYRPGVGGETVIAEIADKRLQTHRDLHDEQQKAEAAIAACSTLTNYSEEDGEWRIEEPEACLELLLDLQALGDAIIVEWPKGEKLRVRRQSSVGDFRLKIQQENEWFLAEGALEVDSSLVLDMRQLLQLLNQTPSRFLPLGDGQFLALTHEFRKRLDELRAFSEQQGQGVRVHPLATVAMDDWLNEVGELEVDPQWQAHLQRIKEVQTLDPVSPSTLQAELRDYQLDGFRWLARLAQWGVGACLADDMGLGKTLQSLALILTRASEGPTLIVAPTSVCMNWVAEAERFAPTLNAIQFGGGDRQQCLNMLQPFDLVVCSYGLLQQDDVAEMLSQVYWQTIVLDEAQWIKNIATKRSQAAMNLQGGFKLITTGTPIENHLGELWNLFRFINPGLLGSLERFNQTFAIPIERQGDRPARARLKKLIQPFVLRRTKAQVLEELPPRTEITLHVDLSAEEIAFYEALRRESLARLSESDAPPGQKQLQILAAIMRLRRTCCNVRLVMPNLSIPSSKLQLFGEVLSELLDNSHKALVFSQFVDHLHIIRDYLDEQQISYQYLDGSTPVTQRQKRVNAFQAGEGDVFLISLKAGGTGLNLTAADYVIHMDPWWNPAVEDQASDRAYRMGQQRPVTIYRLVAKNTIEEKIVELHRHKRDLADSLLEGAEMGSRISTDELLQLIQDI
jgi:superfamily II DNA or RNA helicase